MAKLQLALDGDLTSALAVLERAHATVDIVEIGTPLVFREGMRAVRVIRAAYPGLRLLADLKIMDAGEAEADIAFGAGAGFVTVLGLSGDETIQGALASGKKHGGQVMIDMMGVADPLERAAELIELGCDLLCLHTAHDQQAKRGSPWRQLAQLRAAYPALSLAIAGGISSKLLPQILPLQPQIVVVGSAITAAADPGLAARLFHEGMRRYEDA
ncbi:MAG: orotidine 5'-phosphate decarboxylase [Chloroflexota bacterium]|nr:orotidine 5'-phosphate decarboxylase [Chloroflexota bacterium]